jgi:predicted SprT family Zn-dependent metalloprotease
MELTYFIYACIQILDIKKPVEIRFLVHNKNKATSNLAAWAETRSRKGVIYKHVLMINPEMIIKSEYKLFDVIAHEFVHSLLLENGKHDDNHHHNKAFQNICKVLEKCFNNIGVPLGSLYNPKVDTD